MKRTIPLKQLKERGIKQGDLYFVDVNEGLLRFRGWYLAISEDHAIGITTDLKEAYSNNNLTGSYYRVTRHISSRILANHRKPSDIALFFRTGNEELLRDIILEVSETEPIIVVEAVHFGSRKVYSWLLPKEIDPFTVSINDIALVETSRGNQYVEIIDVKESFNKNINKSVIKIIKMGGILNGK